MGFQEERGRGRIPSHPGSSKETKGLWVQWGYFYEQLQYNSTTTLFIMIKGFVKMPIYIMVKSTSIALNIKMII